jgi:hypothetical protein
MDNLSNSSTVQVQDLTCPITFDVYRDPVLASDGHVYERNAIIRWIQQQGTSPITREPLDVDDLRSEEYIKQLCQPYRSNSVTYSSQTSIVSISSLPRTSSDATTERKICCKQCCNAKRLLTIMAIILIISPFVIAPSVFVLLLRSNSNSTSKI